MKGFFYKLNKWAIKFFNRKILWLVFLLFILFLILSSPLINYKIGNIFFGQVKKLYNVNLAQIFFENSAYPIFGNPYPYAHHQLSRTYFIQGQLEMALDEGDKEIASFPEHLSTYYIIGLTYGYMNREKLAIEAFSKFIEYRPDSWAGRNDKAWLLFRIGDIDSALQTIEPTAKLTENPWVQNTYGTLLMNKKRYAEAKIAFLNAQKAADNMTEEDWGNAYPGNDPRIYASGLEAMKKGIENNLEILEKRR